MNFYDESLEQEVRGGKASFLGPRANINLGARNFHTKLDVQCSAGHQQKEETWARVKADGQALEPKLHDGSPLRA